MKEKRSWLGGWDSGKVGWLGGCETEDIGEIINHVAFILGKNRNEKR